MKPRTVQNTDNDADLAKGQSMPGTGKKPATGTGNEPEQAVSWWDGGNCNPTAAQVHVAIAIIRLKLDAGDRLTDAYLILHSALNSKGWTGGGEDCAPFGVERERARGQHERLAEMLATSGAVIQVLQEFVENVASESLISPSKAATEVLEKVAVLISGIDSVSIPKKGVEGGFERQDSGGQGTGAQPESPEGVAGGI